MSSPITLDGALLDTPVEFVTPPELTTKAEIVQLKEKIEVLRLKKELDRLENPRDTPAWTYIDFERRRNHNTWDALGYGRATVDALAMAVIFAWAYARLI